MSSRKKNSLSNIFTIVEIALALVAFITMFLPTVIIKDSDQTYLGMQIAFGYTQTLGKIIKVDIKLFAASFMAMLPYFLAIVVAIMAAIKMVKKDLNNTVVKFVIALCLLVAGILFIMMPNFIVYGTEDQLSEFFQSINIAFKTNPAETFAITTGAIIGVIASFLGAVTAALDIVKK